MRERERRERRETGERGAVPPLWSRSQVLWPGLAEGQRCWGRR